MAFLAVTRRRHARDALAGLLWPEYNQTRARAALRRTLSSRGVARAEGWLVADREGVDLAHDEVWVDVNRFHDSEAMALYRDDFLSGFALRNSAAFDDWQFFPGEELRRELAGALERLSRGHAGSAGRRGRRGSRSCRAHPLLAASRKSRCTDPSPAWSTG